MDNGNYKYGAPLQRHLSPLKLVSRLLGHEMHVQGSAKAVSFSREQVIEIQSAIDLFIEEASRRVGGGAGISPGGGYGAAGGGSTSLTPSALEGAFVPTRN